MFNRKVVGEIAAQSNNYTIEQRPLFWLLDDAVRRLESAGVSNPSRESREMMAAILGCRPLDLTLRAREPISEDLSRRLDAMLSQRAEGRPLAYILGEWDFAGIRLTVNEDVLIPRPETEELLEMVLKFSERGDFSVADVGTGSGCLAVALAKSGLFREVWGLDISSAALAVARRNAEAHQANVEFAEGYLLFPLLRAGRCDLDAVVANLPYVDRRDMDGLSREVRREPFHALNGGEGGMTLLRRLIPQAGAALRAGGRLFLEVGHLQAVETAESLADHGFANIRIEKDFAGADRFVTGEKR